MSNTVAIIPARGGSKGIPGKNLIDICGRPLVEWSIRQALAATRIDSVWVSSDSQEILEVATSAGANAVLRPTDISGDTASSESAWIHALDVIEGEGVDVEWVFGMQATSPIREPGDLDNALAAVLENGWDSLFSSMKIEDYLVWQEEADGVLASQSYDYKNRQRRQEMGQKYLENGSFYIFRPADIRRYDNRMSGRIGTYVMEKYKSQQVDEPGDVELCRAIMKGYGFDG